MGTPTWWGGEPHISPDLCGCVKDSTARLVFLMRLPSSSSSSWDISTFVIIRNSAALAAAVLLAPCLAASASCVGAWFCPWWCIGCCFAMLLLLCWILLARI